MEETMKEIAKSLKSISDSLETIEKYGVSVDCHVSDFPSRDLAEMMECAIEYAIRDSLNPYLEGIEKAIDAVPEKIERIFDEAFYDEDNGVSIATHIHDIRVSVCRDICKEFCSEYPCDGILNEWCSDLKPKG